MSNDDLAALTELVTAVIDILTIVLLAWAAWDALVNRWIAGALKRGITAIAIWTLFSSLITVTVPTQPPSAVLPTAIYDSSVGPINVAVNPLLPSGMATTSQPGLNLVTMGVSVSQSIWSGIIGYGIIAVPIACCIIMWAIEIATGGVWVSVGLKALLWTLLFALAAGPITAQFPILVLTTAGQLMATVTRSIVNQGGQSTVVTAATAPTWDVTTIATAANSTKAPPGLDSIVAPYIGSCNRSLTQQALQGLKNVSYIGEGADGIVSTLYYVDPTGEASDPKSILQLATPRTNSYNLLMVNADPVAFVTAHFTTPDGTVTNGAGITVGFIKLGASADVSIGVVNAYKVKITDTTLLLRNQIASLQAQNGSPIAVSLLQEQLRGLSEYQPPSVVPVSTVPAITVIRNFITSYYASNANAGTIVTQVLASDPDAWGELWFYQNNPKYLAAFNAANPTAQPPPYPVTTPFLGWAANPVIQNAIVRDEAGVATPSHEFSIWHLWDFMRGLITLLVMSVAETGMAGAILLLKVLVFALAPVILYCAIFLVASGVFVVCLAYPCAAFLALFPGRWTMLLDWSKGVFWVFTWVPIMAVGMSMCSFNSNDLVTAAVSILKSLPVIGASATAVSASTGTNLLGGAGLITGSFMETLAGLFLIVASPMVANLVFHPGLHGISSLTGGLMRNVTAVATGAAAGPVLAAGGAIAAGAKGAAAGAGQLVARAGLVRELPALGGASLAGEVAGGGAASRLRATLGAGTDWAVHAGAAASGALDHWAGGVGSEGSVTRAVAGGTAAIAGRGITGAAVALGAFSDASRIQDRQRRAGLRSLVAPTGITSATDRMSQGISAAMSGDIVSARSLAQGKGEHPGDAEERIRFGAAGFAPRAGLTGDAIGAVAGGSAVRGIAAGGGPPSARSAPLVDPQAQASAARAAASTRLAAGAAASPERQQAARQQAWHASASAHAADLGGDHQGAVRHAVSAMGHALDSGDPLLAMRAAGIYEQAVAHETVAPRAPGTLPPLRPTADGMAAAGVAAGRDQLLHRQRTSGRGLGSVPAITPARDPGEQERSAQQAEQALLALQTGDREPTDRRMAIARTAMVAAVRSGNPELQQRARAQVLETAFDASLLPADDVMTGGALRDAALALAVADPSAAALPSGGGEGAITPTGSAALPSARDSSADYRAALGRAQDGSRLIDSVRHPASALVRATVAGATSALAIARSGNSAGQIAESGEQIERTASAAMRMEAGDAETPVVQIEVAEAMVQAAQGFGQAASLHHAYAEELSSAGDAEAVPERRLSLVSQAVLHRSRSEQLRTRSTASLRTAHHLAGMAMASARTDAALGGGEEQVATLGRVHARAQRLLTAGRAIAEPAAEQDDAELRADGAPP